MSVNHHFMVMVKEEQLNTIVDRIATKFNPDKIILFGSYATNSPNSDSDLDLLIIQDTELPKHKRSFAIYKALIGVKTPLDILVYTNDEFEEEKKKRFSFINSATKASKLLYERER